MVHNEFESLMKSLKAASNASPDTAPPSLCFSISIFVLALAYLFLCFLSLTSMWRLSPQNPILNCSHHSNFLLLSFTKLQLQRPRKKVTLFLVNQIFSSLIFILNNVFVDISDLSSLLSLFLLSPLSSLLLLYSFSSVLFLFCFSILFRFSDLLFFTVIFLLLEFL